MVWVKTFEGKADYKICAVITEARTLKLYYWKSRSEKGFFPLYIRQGKDGEEKHICLSVDF